jgi:hypothetical protein
MPKGATISPDARATACACAVLVSAAALCGCTRSEQDRGPMPRAASGSPSSSAAVAVGPCQRAPKPNDPTNLAHLPPSVGTFCLDPGGSDKAYGEDAKEPIGGLCDLIDGGCEIYRHFGVRRVVAVRYLDGSGTPATIDLMLSKFASRDMAYAMFTERVVGDGDPAMPDAPKPTPSPGSAALGVGNATLWRGSFLAELTLSDERASAATLRTRGDALLPELVRKLGEQLPGDIAPPPAVASLPEQDRLPLGVKFVADEALGVHGTGPAALGYYRAAEQRWRLLDVVGRDVDHAKDVVRSFRALPGASEEKTLGDGGARAVVQDPAGAPQSEWLVARIGNVVAGIGDDTTALHEGMTADERGARTLALADKRRRLQSWLDSLRSAPKPGAK